MDLLNSNDQHRPIFEHSYSFRSEYGLPDLSRASFEALLARFSGDANGGHIGQVGWECSEQISGAIYVPGRSLSHADPGLSAPSTHACSALCGSTPGCGYFMWGHSSPDFTNGSAWCYLLRECGSVDPDDSGDKYQPKCMIGRGPGGGGNGTSSYGTVRVFRHKVTLSDAIGSHAFLSEVPFSYQFTV
jgi:hypothetical protein